VLSLSRFLGRAADPSAAFLQSAVGFSTAGGVAAYKLPELPYAYSALGACVSHTVCVQPLWVQPGPEACTAQDVCTHSTTLLTITSAQHTPHPAHAHAQSR
jgi:hypothetical protein